MLMNISFCTCFSCCFIDVWICSSNCINCLQKLVSITVGLVVVSIRVTFLSDCNCTFQIIWCYLCCKSIATFAALLSLRYFCCATFAVTFAVSFWLCHFRSVPLLLRLFCCATFAVSLSLCHCRCTTIAAPLLVASLLLPHF